MFSWQIRVYYEDTDAGGIVFYANYLKFFERARTEWLRSGGISQSDLAAKHGIMFVVTRTAVDYHSPSKLDNELKLSVEVQKTGRASVEFLQQAWRMDRMPEVRGTDADRNVTATATPILVATGQIKVACVSQHDLRPCAIPEQVLRFIKDSS